METMLEIETITRHIRERAHRIPFKINAVAIFGSWARGGATSNSDIDILVTAENLPAKKRERIPHINLIKESLKLPIPLEVLLLTTEECASYFKNHHPLFLDIAFDAVIIYDTNDFLKRQINDVKDYVHDKKIIKEEDGWRFPVKYREATLFSEVSNMDFAKAMLKDSERDLLLAHEIIKLGIYEKSVYHSQQCAEKAVKSILIAFGRYRKTHFVGGILKEEIAVQDIPEEWRNKLAHTAALAEEIEPEVTWSRYVGIDKNHLWLPYEEYTKKDAEESVKKAEEILNTASEFIRWWFTQSGLSIVATVMIMMILALFAAAAVSLITTAAGTGIQEERGTQAFYIADGGMQYTLKKNTFPYYAVASTNLGDGSFTVSVPILDSNAAIGDTTLSVSTTDGFTAAPDGSYWIMLCDTQAPVSNPLPPLSATASTCEKISCTSKFSGCARGNDGTVAVAHLQNAVVMMYSWDTTNNPTLAQALPAGAKCTGASPKICVSSTSGFANSGFIRINNATVTDREDVFYDGIGSSTGTCGGGCTACLGTNGCTRLAYGDSGNDNDGNYNNDSSNGKAQPSGTTIYQSEFSVLTTSTGRVTGAILTGDIKRVVQGSILSLKDP